MASRTPTRPLKGATPTPNPAPPTPPPPQETRYYGITHPHPPPKKDNIHPPTPCPKRYYGIAHHAPPPAHTPLPPSAPPPPPLELDARLFEAADGPVPAAVAAQSVPHGTREAAPGPAGFIDKDELRAAYQRVGGGGRGVAWCAHSAFWHAS